MLVFAKGAHVDCLPATVLAKHVLNGANDLQALITTPSELTATDRQLLASCCPPTLLGYNTIQAAVLIKTHAKVLYNSVTLLMLPSWLVNSLALMLTVLCKTRKVPLKPSDCVSHVCREATTQDTRWLWTLWSTTSTSCPVACSTRKPSPSLVRDGASVFCFKVHLYLPAKSVREDKGPGDKGREDKEPEKRQCMTVYVSGKTWQSYQ